MENKVSEVKVNRSERTKSRVRPSYQQFVNPTTYKNGWDYEKLLRGKAGSAAVSEAARWGAEHNMYAHFA